MSTLKFKVGDKVDYFGNIGTVTGLDVPVKNDFNKPGALVQWDNKGLVPPEMAVPYSKLQFVGTSLPIGNQAVYGLGEDPWTSHSLSKNNDVEKNCPVCGTEWEDRALILSSFKYCKKCKETKEFLVKKTGTVAVKDGKDIHYSGAD